MPRSAPPRVKPPGANITIKPAEVFTLLHRSGTSYDFSPQGEQVYITHRYGVSADRYLLSKEEARKLWSDLLAKGYERF